MRSFHLTHTANGWVLKEEGAKYAMRTFKTSKESAIQQSAAIMNVLKIPCSLKIHKVNGQIEEERTYPRSGDPATSPG